MTGIAPATTPDESCFAATRALCNTCGALTDAKIVFRDDRVFLVKWCKDHGRTEALISSDLSWYLDSLAYIKPATTPTARAVEEHVGCPDSCGLCPEHQQHTCVPILEITDRCDMACPVCLVDARGEDDLSVEQVREIVGHLLRYEPQVNMLTLSGGEPTLHPELMSILDEVQRPEIGIVSISTNGLSLARDDGLIKALRDRGVVISLQVDGFDPETSGRLRGRPNLGALKRKLIDRIIELGGSLSLTVTLGRGINEHALEELLALLFSSDKILSMMVQPLAYAGRAGTELVSDPLDVLTIPDVVKLLADSSRGVLTPEDFSPLPCSHPTCFALTYLLQTSTGPVPLPRIVDTKSYLDIIKNQALLNTDTDTLIKIQDSLYTLWSSNGIIPDRDSVLKTVRQVLLDLNELGGDPAPRKVLDLGTRHIKSIFIHHFMDRYTFDLSRAIKCCNHYPQVDGKLLPACIRNNIHNCQP